MSNHLYLIRHGETAWSRTHQHTGVTDLALNHHGRRQARELRACLRGITFSHVFSSPLRRARQTCELAGQLGAVHYLAEIAEWNYGRYEGKTTADIRALRPDWDMLRDGCPGGE